jgi:3D (Asp-Asp-Asp) domain-containing protein
MTNFLAVLTVTAYVATGRPAANMKPPKAGITCAASRKIPLGTTLLIEGVGKRVVTDRLAMAYDNRIDLFFETGKRSAQIWGAKKRRIWIVSK